MASTSASLKPLAIRFMMVDGICPDLKARMRATMSSAFCPASRGTPVVTFAPAAWQPEHEDAPVGGPGEEARAAAGAVTTTTAMVRSVLFMTSCKEGAPEGA